MLHCCYYSFIVAMIEFTSSYFSGLESTKMILASIAVSNGVVSSKDINVLVNFIPISAHGKLIK